MRAASSAEAVRSFISHLQQAISCLAQVVVRGNGNSTDHEFLVLLYPQASQVDSIGLLRLHSRSAGEVDLLLSVRQRYIVERDAQPIDRRPYWVRTTSYRYELFDINGRELLAYHWHPGGLSPVEKPHLHASYAPRVQLPNQRGTETRGLDFDRIHLPTGHIPIEDIVEVLIRDFEVQPAREDWETTLGNLRQ